jgi:hopanoid C-3 methylase
LRLYRKRATPHGNFEALEVARALGIRVAVNIIADPNWDEDRFRIVREWAMSVPEIVHLTVNTPYPGTETWLTESRKLTTLDYRLFDVQHAVLPTKLPLTRFYEELVKTQAVLNRKHLGLTALRQTLGRALGLLAQGQTNFLRMLWKFNGVYHPERQSADHSQPITYAVQPPAAGTSKPTSTQLHVHASTGSQRRTVRTEA